MWQGIVLASVVVLSLSSIPARGQSSAVQTNLVNTQDFPAAKEGAHGPEPADFKKGFEEMQAARYMAQRRAELRRDTEKLVALTAELKSHVDETGPNILSMDVIKKAVEIQKLAKSVEEKMKRSY